jgi:HTH-type transcriptional regulator / antitoxin HigA
MNRPLKNEYRPEEVSLPGETLAEVLEEHGLSQADLAERMGRPKKTINEIVKGRAAVTPETALQLEHVLGIPAEFWNNLERNYREHLARREEANQLEGETAWLRQIPVSALVRKGWIAHQTTELGKIREVLNFFGIASPEQWQGVFAIPQASFKRSISLTCETGALAAWLRKGEIEGRSVECAQYDAAQFRSRLQRVRSLTTEHPEDFFKDLRDVCRDSGVAVVLVPQLSRCPVFGAARWLTPTKALIQLSLRYRTDDLFWFTFFHESAHLLLHGKRDVFVDGESLDGASWEEEANQFAADLLIPRRELEALRAPGEVQRISRRRVLDFAQDLGVAPGIVVGRLQHEGWLPRTHLNDLKQRLDWAALETG